MPIQVSFSTDNLTPEEARWIASLVQPTEVDLSQIEPEISEYLRDRFVVVDPTPTETISAMLETSGATLEVNNGEPKIVIPPVALAEETVEGHIAELAAIPAADSTGLPWDERIHASSKALNADGTWRTKRGVDKALVASIEAELRQSGGYEVAGEIDTDPGERVPFVQLVHHERTDEQAPENVETREAPVDAYISTTSVVPPPPPAPPAPIFPVPSNPTQPGTSPFVSLMKRVTTAQSAGKLTQPRVKELLESMEKKSIMDLRTDEDAQAAFGLLLDGEGV